MKRYLIISLCILALSSCATTLTFDENTSDNLVLTDFAIEPEYFFPGTYIPLFRTSYQTSSTFTNPDQTGTTVAQTNSFPIADIGIRVNNILCIDEFGNLFLYIPGLIPLEERNTLTIDNGNIQFIQNGDHINIIRPGILKRDLSYLIKDNGVFEVVKNENRPFVLFTEKGIEYYDYAVLGADIQKIEYLDDGSVDLLHSILTDIKGFQETNEEVTIKQRFLMKSLKYQFTRISPKEIQIEIDPGFFHRKRVYTLKVNGSELLFTNKKGEGTHLTIRNNAIMIQRTVDAFIGNEIRESRISIVY